MNTVYDLVVIGSGPGGYKAAEKAAKAGLNTAVVERSEIGGICTNWGCIPTKALLKSAEVLHYMKSAKQFGISPVEPSFDFAEIISRSRKIANQTGKGVEMLLNKHNVQVITGTASFIDSSIISIANGGETQTVSAKHFIIATGARAKEIGAFPFDGDKIISYKDALNLDDLPQSLAVIGSGAIGIELAYFYASLGCAVSVFEAEEQILPAFDADVADQISRSLKKLKVKIYAGASVLSVLANAGGVSFEASHNGKTVSVVADKLLVAAGIVPNAGDICAADAGVELDPRGYVVTDEHCKTSADNIYAIGDVRNTPALAHVAYAEADVAVNAIIGLSSDNESVIPFCIYSKPEIGCAGLTEKQALLQGIEVDVKKFPFSALGKATAAGDRDGFAKLIFSKTDGVLLGGVLVGNSATENVGWLVQSINLKLRAKVILAQIFPHPSYIESVWEAAHE